MGRDVIAFYTDTAAPQQGIIAPMGQAFFCPHKVPKDGMVKRFLVQFPAGTGYLVTVRLFYETECKVPLPGFGYIQMENDKYDNQNLNISVKSGRRLRVEVQNFSIFQQQLFALVEIEPTPALPTLKQTPRR